VTNAAKVAVLRWPLRAAAPLYAAAVRARNRFYDRPGRSCRAAAAVVSVGNLTVGGTGKTPLVRWIAARLRDDGQLPAIVSRGYGGRAGRGPLEVSHGSGPLCAPADCGDEPFMLAESLPGVLVVVGSDRCRATAKAVSLGADVIVLDDGFQHRRIARDLDIVLLDARAPFGNGRMIPAGTLREPIGSLCRAGLVVITRSRPQDGPTEIDRKVRRHNPHVPILRAGSRRLGFRDVKGRPVPPPRRALPFCGIGQPAGFHEDVVAEGVEIVGFVARRDHYRFREDELESLRERAARLDAVRVTTEKDLARLSGGKTKLPTSLLTLAIETVPYDEATLVGALGDAVAGSRRP